MDSMVVFSFCGGAVSKFEFIYPCRIELRIAVGGWNIFPSSRLTNCSRLFVCLFFWEGGGFCSILVTLCTKRPWKLGISC
jgi:hypothetical protein